MGDTSTPTRSACRSCRAPLRWGVTQDGKTIPLDREPNPEGNVVLTARTAELRAGGTGPIVEVLGGQLSLFSDDRTRYMPHHATCPDAEAWRRPSSTA